MIESRKNQKKSNSFAFMLAVSMCLFLIVGCNQEKKTRTEYYFQEPDVSSGDCIAPSFPSEVFVINSDNNINVTGELQLKINKMEIFDNLNDANISPNHITASHIQYSLTNGRKIVLMYPYYFDGDTGNLVDGCYLFMFEVEITNVNAEYVDIYEGTKDNLFALGNIISLQDYSYTAHEGILRGGSVAYFAEGKSSEGRGNNLFELDKGETKTLHFGYLVFDRCESPFTRMAVLLGNSDSYDDVRYWFDASQMIAEIENK